MIDTSSWRAVLFDLDGVLVDSLPLHYQAYMDALAPLGVEITQSDFIRDSAGPASVTIPKLLKRPVDDAELHSLHAMKIAAFEARLAADPIPRLPLCGLVPVLSGTVPLGLVTSASRPTVAAIDAQVQLLVHFDVVITGDDVNRGKPEPDPYLEAGRLLGVPAEHCLVFEDSPGGVASATRAGMSVVMVGPPIAAAMPVRS